MNPLHQAKFTELFIEFNRYLIEHPEFASNIPPNAQVVLLDSHDLNYSQQAIANAQKAGRFDDLPQRTIVYIEVREMAPLQSRVREVEVLTTPPHYAL